MACAQRSIAMPATSVKESVEMTTMNPQNQGPSNPATQNQPQQPQPQQQYVQHASEQPQVPTQAQQQPQATPVAAQPHPQQAQPNQPVAQQSPTRPNMPAPKMPYSSQPYSPQIPQPQTTTKYNGFAIAGLVVGLVAITATLWRIGDYVNPFSVVGLVLSIIGFATTSGPREDGTTSQAQRVGHIFAIAGIIICAIALIATPFITAFYGDSSLFGYSNMDRYY